MFAIGGGQIENISYHKGGHVGLKILIISEMNCQEEEGETLSGWRGWNIEIEI